MARPKAVAQDLEKQVEQLAAINCSWEEIGAVLGMHEKTARRRFARAYKNGRGQGTASLKKTMYSLASKGNVTMLIWLSKQMMGYADKVEQKNDDTGSKTHLVVYETSLGSSTASQGPAVEPVRSTPGAVETSSK